MDGRHTITYSLLLWQHIDSSGLFSSLLPPLPRSFLHNNPGELVRQQRDNKWLFFFYQSAVMDHGERAWSLVGTQARWWIMAEVINTCQSEYWSRQSVSYLGVKMDNPDVATTPPLSTIYLLRRKLANSPSLAAVVNSTLMINSLL